MTSFSSLLAKFTVPGAREMDAKLAPPRCPGGTLLPVDAKADKDTLAFVDSNGDDVLRLAVACSKPDTEGNRLLSLTPIAASMQDGVRRKGAIVIIDQSLSMKGRKEEMKTALKEVMDKMLPGMCLIIVCFSHRSSVTKVMKTRKGAWHPFKEVNGVIKCCHDEPAFDPMKMGFLNGGTEYSIPYRLLDEIIEEHGTEWVNIFFTDGEANTHGPYGTKAFDFQETYAILYNLQDTDTVRIDIKYALGTESVKFISSSDTRSLVQAFDESLDGLRISDVRLQVKKGLLISESGSGGEGASDTVTITSERDIQCPRKVSLMRTPFLFVIEKNEDETAEDDRLDITLHMKVFDGASSFKEFVIPYTCPLLETLQTSEHLLVKQAAAQFSASFTERALRKTMAVLVDGNEPGTSAFPKGFREVNDLFVKYHDYADMCNRIKHSGGVDAAGIPEALQTWLSFKGMDEQAQTAVTNILPTGDELALRKFEGLLESAGRWSFEDWFEAFFRGHHVKLVLGCLSSLLLTPEDENDFMMVDEDPHGDVTEHWKNVYQKEGRIYPPKPADVAPKDHFEKFYKIHNAICDRLLGAGCPPELLRTMLTKVSLQGLVDTDRMVGFLGLMPNYFLASECPSLDDKDVERFAINEKLLAYSTSTSTTPQARPAVPHIAWEDTPTAEYGGRAKYNRRARR